MKRLTNRRTYVYGNAMPYGMTATRYDMLCEGNNSISQYDFLARIVLNWYHRICTAKVVGPTRHYGPDFWSDAPDMSGFTIGGYVRER